ncbi:non-canonical purine NTP pyrophosphatase, partial [Salmonella enterica]|uniref:non-canonical purine NTP pyrophosphatase n=1 Tax=Salmonella enterica TaxID=28901 RepID=UPI003D2A7BF6
MMQGVENRKAKLVIALAVVDRDGSIVFQDESILSGSIAYEPKGLNGFGYDPIFIADKSYGHTLAEIDGARKN